MIAYIRKMAVEKKHWLDGETFSEGVVLCRMIPGATAMQTAAYVGLKTQGVVGAGASFIGFGLPAFLLMLTFAALYTNNHNLPIVISAFSGLQAIIANAALSFGKNTLKELEGIRDYRHCGGSIRSQCKPDPCDSSSRRDGIGSHQAQVNQSCSSCLFRAQPDLHKITLAHSVSFRNRFSSAFHFQPNFIQFGYLDVQD